MINLLRNERFHELLQEWLHIEESLGFSLIVRGREGIAAFDSAIATLAANRQLAKDRWRYLSDELLPAIEEQGLQLNTLSLHVVAYFAQDPPLDLQMYDPPVVTTAKRRIFEYALPHETKGAAGALVFRDGELVTPDPFDGKGWSDVAIALNQMPEE